MKDNPVEQQIVKMNKTPEISSGSQFKTTKFV